MKQGCKLWGGEKRERVLIIHVGERFWEGKKGDIMKMQTFLLSLSPKIYVYRMKKFGVIIFFCLAIGSVGTMEYGKYVASGEECDHV